MNQGFGPKKPNYQLYAIIALIVCICCCSSSMMSYYRVSIRPNGNMLQGYANGAWWRRSGGIGDPRGRPKQTNIAQCRAYARERGYAGVGYRTDAHPSAPWRNTCFFFTKPDGGWQGNDKDLAHKVGCTDPGKSWGNC